MCCCFFAPDTSICNYIGSLVMLFGENRVAKLSLVGKIIPAKASALADQRTISKPFSP